MKYRTHAFPKTLRKFENVITTTGNIWDHTTSFLYAYIINIENRSESTTYVYVMTYAYNSCCRIVSDRWSQQSRLTVLKTRYFLQNHSCFLSVSLMFDWLRVSNASMVRYFWKDKIKNDFVFVCPKEHAYCS